MTQSGDRWIVENIWKSVKRLHEKWMVKESTNFTQTQNISVFHVSHEHFENV